MVDNQQIRQRPLPEVTWFVPERSGDDVTLRVPESTCFEDGADQLASTVPLPLDYIIGQRATDNPEYQKQPQKQHGLKTHKHSV